MMLKSAVGNATLLFIMLHDALPAVSGSIAIIYTDLRHVCNVRFVVHLVRRAVDHVVQRKMISSPWAITILRIRRDHWRFTPSLHLRRSQASVCDPCTCGCEASKETRAYRSTSGSKRRQDRFNNMPGKRSWALTVLQRLCAEDSPRHQTRRHLCPLQHPLPLRQPWHRRLSFPDFSLPDLSLPAREPKSNVTTTEQPGRSKSTPMGAAHPILLRRGNPRTGVRPQGGAGQGATLRHVTPTAAKVMCPTTTPRSSAPLERKTGYCAGGVSDALPTYQVQHCAGAIRAQLPNVGFMFDFGRGILVTPQVQS
jgi:hypothetical protein